jgi:hypothetical protein
MIPILIGVYLRRWPTWIHVATFCEGLSAGLVISGITLLIFLVLTGNA